MKEEWALDGLIPVATRPRSQALEASWEALVSPTTIESMYTLSLNC